MISVWIRTVPPVKTVFKKTCATGGHLLDQYFRVMRFMHQRRGELGRIEVLEPEGDSFEARERTTIRIVYHVGKLSLPKGTKIRFGWTWYTDISPFQFSRPSSYGYTTVHTNNPSVRLAKGAFPPEHEGPLVFEAKDKDGALRGRSNPVHSIGPDEPHVNWGDLHTHEGYTDGSGTAEWVMSYGRNIGFLDFQSLTGHDILMSEFYWRVCR